MMNQKINLATAMVAIKSYKGFYNDHHADKLESMDKVLGVCELVSGKIGMLLSVDCYYSINEVYVDDFGYAHVGTNSISGTVHCNEMFVEEDIARFNETIFGTSSRIIRVLYMDGRCIEVHPILGVKVDPDAVKAAAEETMKKAIEEEKEELTMKERIKVALKNTKIWMAEKLDGTDNKYYYLALVFLFIINVIDIKIVGYKKHAKKCFIYTLIPIVTGIISVIANKAADKCIEDIVNSSISIKEAIKNAPTMDIDDLDK